WRQNGASIPQPIGTAAGNGVFVSVGDGLAATNAGVASPYAVAVNNFGALFIVDPEGARVRRVDTNGIITTLAGNGIAGFLGDGGAATNARLDTPSGVAADRFGNVFIADSYNQRIRKVDRNGVITTVAGSGSYGLGNGGFSGDGGAATN